MAHKADNSILNRIFEYDDYRLFLKDYYEEQKSIQPSFSYRFFAKKSGLSSQSLFVDVVKGRLNLTMKTIPKMVRGLGLRGRAASFFKNLVLFNQSREDSGREEHFRELSRIRRGSKLYKINESQYAYFDTWYFPVIRELAVYSDWDGDYARLASIISPPVSETQAREAVEAMEKMRILVRGRDGGFHHQAPGLTTSGVPYAILKAPRRDLMKHAIAASDALGPHKRFIAHATISMSERSYEEAVRICDEARKRIVDLALNDENVEKVYEIMMQLFPLSRRLKRPQDSKK
jgi:uncharacterized protein (TIGR02147 family)